MDQRFIRLLRRQQAAGFADLAGAEATVTVPVSDRLLNEVIAEVLPRSGAVRDMQVHAQPGGRIGIRAKVGVATFLPPINLTLLIDRQPELPASPVLTLRLATGGLLSLAGPALRFLDALPPGVRVEGDRIHVDLATLLGNRGLGSLLEHVEQLRVETAEGAVIVSLRASIRGGR